MWRVEAVGSHSDQGREGQSASVVSVESGMWSLRLRIRENIALGASGAGAAEACGATRCFGEVGDLFEGGLDTLYDA